LIPIDRPAAGASADDREVGKIRKGNRLQGRRGPAEIGAEDRADAERGQTEDENIQDDAAHHLFGAEHEAKQPVSEGDQDAAEGRADEADCETARI
jgi:hypothetical protein